MSNHRLDQNAVDSITNFLQSNVKSSCVDNIQAELKKEYVFAKKKNRVKTPKAKTKRVYLNRNEKKRLNFFHLSREGLKYDDFVPMNLMWNEYISNVLQLNEVPTIESKAWDNFTQTLYKADFHGCIFKVLRSKCPSYVDKIGICVLDTRNIIKILSKDNKLTTIPKKECVFEIYVNNKKLVLFGKQLCARPADRSNKKIKVQNHPDL